MTVLLPRIKQRMAIHAHRAVRGLLEGEYAAAQTGRSLDFNDLREYVRGDDVKDLEWKASARSGQLLVKRYAAVRKHTIQLVVSTGRSMAAHHAPEVTKRDLSVFVAGVIGLLAVRHGDRVAMAYGDAASQHALPPGAGEMHLERCLEAAYDATSTSGAPSDLAAVLGYVARTVRRRTILLIVCDETGVDDDLAAALRRLVVQHEVLLVTIDDLDPTGVAAGAPGVVDIDSGAPLPAWARADAALAREYADTVLAERTSLGQRLDQLGVVNERVHDHASAITAVFRLLERHRHARRR